MRKDESQNPNSQPFDASESQSNFESQFHSEPPQPIRPRMPQNSNQDETELNVDPLRISELSDSELSDSELDSVELEHLRKMVGEALQARELKRNHELRDSLLEKLSAPIPLRSQDSEDQTSEDRNLDRLSRLSLDTELNISSPQNNEDLLDESQLTVPAAPTKPAQANDHPKGHLMKVGLALSLVFLLGLGLILSHNQFYRSHLAGFASEPLLEADSDKTDDLGFGVEIRGGMKIQGMEAPFFKSADNNSATKVRIAPIQQPNRSSGTLSLKLNSNRLAKIRDGSINTIQERSLRLGFNDEILRSQPNQLSQPPSTFEWSEKRDRRQKSLDRNLYPSGGETYSPIRENRFLEVRGENVFSTFSIDVDTASYANLRRLIRRGKRPPENSVRIEELINYFRYEYPRPNDSEEPFSVSMEVADCPWQKTSQLVRIGIQGYDLDRNERPASNLVFLD